MSINLILPHSSTFDAIAPEIPIKMIPLRRPASRILSRLSRSQQRRLASTEGGGIGGRQDISSGHADSAGQAHSTSHGHHPEPVNESLGRGFYLTLAALPASFALYKLSRPSDDSTDPASQPWLTRVIHSYDHWRDEWESRNTLHTAAIEQAAHDRHLFHGTKGSHVIELRFPEYVSPFSPSLDAVPSLPSHLKCANGHKAAWQWPRSGMSMSTTTDTNYLGCSMPAPPSMSPPAPKQTSTS